jgi:hypothetical protein
MKYLKRIKWIIALLLVHPKAFSSVGNRTIYKGQDKGLHITVILTEVNKPGGYSREELLNLLQLIRNEEERHGWKTPEPVRCVTCNHCSPPDKDGGCPVIDKRDRSNLSCPCLNHAAGLTTAMKKEINKSVKRDDGFIVNPVTSNRLTSKEIFD